MQPRFLLLFFLSFMSVSICRADFIVDFGTGSNFYNPPYSEDGLTLTLLSNSAAWVIGPWDGLPGNNSISTGANGFTGVRVTSNVGLIDLRSFDVRSVSLFQSSWRIQSSTGASFTIPSGNASQTINLPSAGWTGISHFEISANGANAGMRLDNIRFQISSVPEPGSAILLLLSGLGVLASRTRRRPGETPGLLDRGCESHAP